MVIRSIQHALYFHFLPAPLKINFTFNEYIYIHTYLHMYKEREGKHLNAGVI